MKFCDVTIAYNGKSGGIRTYIDEKRRYLREHTDHEHLLIVPGKRTSVRRSGRFTTVSLRGPLLPGQDAYRFFLTPVAVRKVLEKEQPDYVELGSYYTEPWAAFSYRRRRHESGRRCVLGAYFHTDVAEAYVASPLRTASHAWLDDVSETLANAAERIADVVAGGAERYMSYIFTNCDVALASSDVQAERLRAQGVEDVEIIPMGVDLGLFHPRKRSDAMRRRLGADSEALVLMYAGRMSEEKRVLTLVRAFERLPPDRKAQLWLVGDGSLRPDLEAAVARSEGIRLLPYESDRDRFAALLASADLYVTAGPFETFGLSVLEAHASGLPVVGVDAGALRERVAESLGYLGPVDDAGAMADNIARAARERSDIGARARAHAERLYGWPSAFKRLVACYDEAPRRAGRAPTKTTAASR